MTFNFLDFSLQTYFKFFVFTYVSFNFKINIFKRDEFWWFIYSVSLTVRGDKNKSVLWVQTLVVLAESHHGWWHVFKRHLDEVAYPGAEGVVAPPPPKLLRHFIGNVS